MWLIESAGNPATDPLVVWLQGLDFFFLCQGEVKGNAIERQ
jgi:hypothetical protein